MGDFRQLVGPGDGQVPIRPARENVRRNTAQVFDQRQAQHDWNGPQLAQPKRRDRLVGRDETAEAVGVDPPVAVGDSF